MSTNTRWERFCDWLSGPPIEETRPTTPPVVVPPPPEPEPIRPFVAKLAECIRLGDYTQEEGSNQYSSWVVIKFALADDLSAAVEIATWGAFPYCYGVVPVWPRLCSITLGATQTTDFNGAEEAAILGAHQLALEEEGRKAKIRAEASKAAAIAKIEAYTPKAPEAKP